VQVPGNQIPDGPPGQLSLSGVVSSHSAPKNGVVWFWIEVDSTNLNGRDGGETYGVVTVPVPAAQAARILRSAKGVDPRVGFAHVELMADVSHAYMLETPPVHISTP